MSQRNVVAAKAFTCDNGVVMSEPLLSSENAGIACTFKQMVNLGQDYFSVFGLQPSVDIDLSELALRYRQLQQAVHPDRFLRECDRSQRLAEQQASLVNTAYQVLKQPLSRAQYLLELAGEAGKTDDTTRDIVFLTEQMGLREQLSEAEGLQGLDELDAVVASAWQAHWAAFCQAWQLQDWTAARSTVNKLQFANKLTHDIDARRDRLLEA